MTTNGSSIADDLDGDPVFLARNQFYLDYTRERAAGIVVHRHQGREEGRSRLTGGRRRSFAVKWYGLRSGGANGP